MRLRACLPKIALGRLERNVAKSRLSQDISLLAITKRLSVREAGARVLGKESSLTGLQFGRGEKKFGRGEHILSISTSVGVKRIRLAYAKTSLGVKFF